MIGSIAHDVMESLTLEKIKKGYVRTDPEKRWESIQYKYSKKYPEEFSQIQDKKIQEVRKKMNKMWEDKIYSPLYCDPIAAEQKFEIILEDVNIKIIGYIDRIQKRPDGSIEIVDLKTGQQKKFTTERNQGKLQEEDMWADIQMQLYGFAAKKLYPEYENEIYATLYFIKGDGPLTVKIGEIDEQIIIDKLKFYVQRVQNNENPKRKKGFWCNFCDFGKKRMDICDSTFIEITHMGKSVVEDLYREFNGKDPINRVD